jgi:hypothetical protein
MKKFIISFFLFLATIPLASYSMQRVVLQEYINDEGKRCKLITYSNIGFKSNDNNQFKVPMNIIKYQSNGQIFETKDGARTWTEITEIKNIKISNVTIFPNPASSDINVSMDGLEDIQSIMIYDYLGNLCYSISSIENISTLNIGQLSTGKYYLHIVTNKTQFNVPFIKD